MPADPLHAFGCGGFSGDSSPARLVTVPQEILRAGDYLMLRTVVSGLWVYVNTSGVPMLG